MSTCSHSDADACDICRPDSPVSLPIDGKLRELRELEDRLKCASPEAQRQIAVGNVSWLIIELRAALVPRPSAAPPSSACANPNCDGGGPPYWKGVGQGLFEIRWCRNHRVYCSVEEGRSVVMFHALIKTWPKFKHRTLCDSRRADYLSADYDKESRELKHRAYCQRRGENGPV